MTVVPKLITSLITGYATSKLTDKPNIPEPKKQPDPNNLANKRMKQRTLAQRYGDTGRDSTNLTGSSTLG